MSDKEETLAGPSTSTSRKAYPSPATQVPPLMFGERTWQESTDWFGDKSANAKLAQQRSKGMFNTARVDGGGGGHARKDKEQIRSFGQLMKYKRRQESLEDGHKHHKRKGKKGKKDGETSDPETRERLAEEDKVGGESEASPELTEQKKYANFSENKGGKSKKAKGKDKEGEGKKTEKTASGKGSGSQTGVPDKEGDSKKAGGKEGKEKKGMEDKKDKKGKKEQNKEKKDKKDKKTKGKSLVKGNASQTKGSGKGSEVEIKVSAKASESMTGEGNEDKTTPTKERKSILKVTESQKSLENKEEEVGEKSNQGKGSTRSRSSSIEISHPGTPQTPEEKAEQETAAEEEKAEGLGEVTGEAETPERQGEKEDLDLSLDEGRESAPGLAKEVRSERGSKMEVNEQNVQAEQLNWTTYSGTKPDPQTREAPLTSHLHVLEDVSSDISFDSRSSTGGPIIAKLNVKDSPTFFMNPGDITAEMFRAVSFHGDTSNSNSSSLNPSDDENAPYTAPSSPSRMEVDQLKELSRLHRQMLDMQTKNFELTKAVAQGGAATAEAVRLLLAAQTPGAVVEQKVQEGESKPLLAATQRTGPSPPEYTKEQAGPVYEAAFGVKETMQAPKPVLIKVVFLRIIEIDTLAQHFEAEVYIEARWTERRLQGMSMAGLGKIEFHQCWDPRLKLVNMMGEPDMEKTSMVLRYEPDAVAPVLVYMWHIRAIFREPMELQHFPFDVQELSLVISSDLPITHLDLREDPAHDSSVNLGAMQESEEWSNYRHVEFTIDVATQEMEGTSKHPVLVVAAHAKRRLGSYFWNIAIVVFLILALSFTLLAVEPTATDRLGIVMTLFLTAVAFKLVVKSSLPTISYLTYLDIYVVFSLIYLFLHGAENALMLHLARYRDPPQVRYYDEIAQACLISLLILFHLVFLIYIQVTALSRRRDMVRLDHNFKLQRLKRKRERKERIDAASQLDKN